MAQFGKASAKRGKPSYIYAIIGVALVLFLFGIVGWIFMNIRKTGEYFKENIQVHAWIERAANKKQIDTVKNYIASLPYVKDVEYVTRDKAVEKWNAQNDTIRLAMYSNRFLIKTMQMVGATRGFIARPLNVRAIINGLIAAGVAIVLLLSFVGLAEKFVPYFKVLYDTSNMLLLFMLMIILGLLISLFSTHRSVLKYLKMKLDDLY
jgi:cell division protein FtsX